MEGTQAFLTITICCVSYAGPFGARETGVAARSNRSLPTRWFGDRLAKYIFASPHGEEGHFVADRLRLFIEGVRHVLEGAAAKHWTAEDIARHIRAAVCDYLSY